METFLSDMFLIKQIGLLTDTDWLVGYVLKLMLILNDQIDIFYRQSVPNLDIQIFLIVYLLPL